jgi:hypothetical protein
VSLEFLDEQFSENIISRKSAPIAPPDFSFLVIPFDSPQKTADFNVLPSDF